MKLEDLILTREEINEILIRVAIEDSVEAYMDVYFVEEFGDGSSFFKEVKNALEKYENDDPESDGDEK